MEKSPAPPRAACAEERTGLRQKEADSHQSQKKQAWPRTAGRGKKKERRGDNEVGKKAKTQSLKERGTFYYMRGKKTKYQAQDQEADRQREKNWRRVGGDECGKKGTQEGSSAQDLFGGGYEHRQSVAFSVGLSPRGGREEPCLERKERIIFTFTRVLGTKKKKKKRKEFLYRDAQK